MQGEICDIDGNCVDAAEDELFKLTTKEGKISVEREKVRGWGGQPVSCRHQACGRAETLPGNAGFKFNIMEGAWGHC